MWLHSTTTSQPTTMSAFVMCSATAAAGLAVAFEVGRVAEKRISGTNKLAMPFEGFDYKSQDAKLAAYVFAGLFFVEIVFVPKALNPFSYLTSTATTSSVSSLLALFVFGSWSGLLAVGFGGVAGSYQALNLERAAIERERDALDTARAADEARLEEEKQVLAKQKRINFASAAAVAGEWKKLHIAREEDLHRGLERSENEKMWSTKISKEFDKKVMHVVDNATDKRWREIEDQDLTLEAMRLRNKEKQKRLQEERALRAERTNMEKETLKEETSKLLKMTDELDGLKANIEKLKEENKKKEQEKIRELKEREAALSEKEKTLEETHNKKVEELKRQEQSLKSKEAEFESGEELKKLKELSEQLESSKLTVARFNETVMNKEKQKLEEFRQREEELAKKEEELAKRSAAATARFNNMFKDEVHDDDKSVPMRLLTERDLGSVYSSRDSSLKEIGEDAVILFDEPEESEIASNDMNSKEAEKPSTTSLTDMEKKEENVPETNVAPEKATVLGNKSLLDVENDANDESIASSTVLIEKDGKPEDRNDVSDSDSLSHQIQRDLAAHDRKESLDITIGEQEAVMKAPGAFSPLQERIRNNYFGGYFATEKKQVEEKRMDFLPMSPTSNTMASQVTFKNALPYSRSNVTKQHDTVTIFSTISSIYDPDYVVLDKAEQENVITPKNERKKSRKASSRKKSKSKKNYVVSEDAAVEVIAWSDPGPY